MCAIMKSQDTPHLWPLENIEILSVCLFPNMQYLQQVTPIRRGGNKTPPKESLGMGFKGFVVLHNVSKEVLIKP